MNGLVKANKHYYLVDKGELFYVGKTKTVTEPHELCAIL